MATETVTLAPGAFCWVDLVTSDTVASKKFYGDLFGWKTTEHPMGEGGGTYTMFGLDGQNVSGMMELHPEMRKMGAVPHWLSHVYVKDADTLVKRASELGGKVVKGPMDMGGAGRAAVLQDPTGAIFCLWQPKQLGPALYNQPGALTWNELWTTDTAAARDFYTGLLNWSPKEQNFGPMPYTVFENQGRPNGGMMTIPEDAQKMGAPPNWMVYFAVADCDATVQQATAKGAKVLAPPMEIPTVGRFAVLADPQGAAFAVIKPADRTN